MRTSILAFAAVLMITGCGDNGTVKLDGSTNNKPDLSMKTTTPPDLAMGKATNCGAIFTCEFQDGKPAATCQAGTPKASQDGFNAVLTCMQTACGLNIDGGATSPCSTQSMATDAGADMCNTCLTNTWFGPMSIFGSNDPTMMGKPQACSPDNNAPHCGECATQVTNCFVQCTTDADCMGITSAGAPTTCQSGSCM